MFMVLSGHPVCSHYRRVAATRAAQTGQGVADGTGADASCLVSYQNSYETWPSNQWHGRMLGTKFPLTTVRVDRAVRAEATVSHPLFPG